MGAKKEENQKSQQAKTGSRKSRMNSGKMVNSGSGRKQFRNPTKFLLCSISFVFSALFSFWTLICNVEFDSNSLCLDRLNNFGINSLQKLQN